MLIDVLRSAYAQTAVAPYAVRARPGAPVAVPLEWEELDDRGFRPDRCTVRSVFDFLERRRDPWSDLYRSPGSSKSAAERLRGWRL